MNMLLGVRRSRDKVFFKKYICDDICYSIMHAKSLQAEALFS
jgi:hypothetical protein